ncbi:unnamed protein product [Hermetia illucens]|uniref:Uncharacterized protein n=1 Tax=Hermetia illucens TaxID=343691 RepID=A0A7R8UVE5_HERIL|nr:unnamed protein product [Hermetia illucens]
MEYEQIKIAKLEHALTEVMAELRAARALNEKLSALIDNLNKKLEEKEMPVKTENNKRIRLEIPSASEDGNESPAEEEPLADSQSEEASSMDEDEMDVQDDKTDDFPPLPPPKPVVQLPPPPKPITKVQIFQFYHFRFLRSRYAVIMEAGVSNPFSGNITGH